MFLTYLSFPYIGTVVLSLKNIPHCVRCKICSINYILLTARSFIKSIRTSSQIKASFCNPVLRSMKMLPKVLLLTLLALCIYSAAGNRTTTPVSIKLMLMLAVENIFLRLRQLLAMPTQTKISRSHLVHPA